MAHVYKALLNLALFHNNKKKKTDVTKSKQNRIPNFMFV